MRQGACRGYGTIRPATPTDCRYAESIHRICHRPAAAARASKTHFSGLGPVFEPPCQPPPRRGAVFLFFVFVFPLPPTGFKPLGRPLTERSKTLRPGMVSLPALSVPPSVAGATYTCYCAPSCEHTRCVHVTHSSPAISPHH